MDMSFASQKHVASYELFENERYSVAKRGVIALLDEVTENANASYDVLDIAQKLFEGALDFNRIIGFFRIVICEKATGKTVFFCDNSGSQRFYYAQEYGLLSDSLHSLSMQLPNAQPDYSAIAQVFAWGSTFDDTTIYSGISKTSLYCYYTLDNGKISANTKKLKSFYELGNGLSLHKVTQLLVEGIKREQLNAVATGGTDSRSVLAVLYSLGIRPDLIITGHDDNPDVAIAHTLADMLKLKLNVFNPGDRDDDWLAQAFEFSDGAYDVVMCYRHQKKCKLTSEQGFEYEFGGTGGEFYKCFPYQPMHRGTFFVPRQLVYRFLFRESKGVSYFGEKIQAQMKGIAAKMPKHSNDIIEFDSRRHYSESPFVVITSKASNITEILSQYTIKIDPLMDRNVIASGNHERISPLYMLAEWQKRQVSTYCPQIMDVQTDKGLSCSTDKKTIASEKRKLFRLFIGRKVFRKRSLQPHIWDTDYLAARETDCFKAALNTCKRLGVIAENAVPTDIPLLSVGNVLLVGLSFSETNS